MKKNAEIDKESKAQEELNQGKIIELGAQLDIILDGEPIEEAFEALCVIIAKIGTDCIDLSSAEKIDNFIREIESKVRRFIKVGFIARKVMGIND